MTVPQAPLSTNNRIRGGGGGCFVVLAAQSLHAFVYHAEAVHEAQWMESEYRIQQPNQP
jgi:hypothetical protein